MIGYQIPTTASVHLSIYTMLGREVVTLVNSMQKAGYHHLEWNGRDSRGTMMPNGWYVYRLNVDEHGLVRRIRKQVPSVEPIS